MDSYDHTKIEKKWQAVWEKDKSSQAKDPKNVAGGNNEAAKKFYALIEFPYPSGDGLHVGHPRPYIGMDVIARKRRMQGYNVLYPIGWDAFGLPTENYAIKTGKDPRTVTEENTKTFTRQIKSLAISFDWSREINTTDPKYYKWTQWIFLQFLKAGLAYKKKMAVNWCPKDLIVLANEEVIDGKCERCGTAVEKREKEQWMLGITKYADKLLEGLDAVDYGDPVTGAAYVMPTFIDMTNPHQPGKPIVKRHVAHAIVFDPQAKKYLIIRNKKFGWDTLVIGGIENGESVVDTARREVCEETGYVDLEFKRILGGPTEAHYYTKHKGENRIAIAQAVYFELKSGGHETRVPITDVDDIDKDNEILWIDEADFVPGKMVNSELPMWLARMKDASKDSPKPLLDWPDYIKEAQRNWIGRSEGAEIDFEIIFKKDKANKTRFVLIHGFTGSPHANFFPWLKAELEKRGHEVEVPELPNSSKPTEVEQVNYVLKNCHFDEQTVVIGHSLGAIVAMKALIQLNKPISGLVIVAAAVDPKFHTGAEDSRPFDKGFSWDFDYSLIRQLTGGKIAVLSDTREDFRMPYLRHLAEKLPARLVETTAAGEHFCAEKESEILKAVTPSIPIFTTRADTLFGVTYVVVAPEHPWVNILLSHVENKSEVEKYIATAKGKTDIIRTDLTREKTGVEMKGIYAINPANGEKVPVWIADYVLADYGTGAVMAVPAHDERDWDFAEKYKLPVRQVILKKDYSAFCSYLMGAKNIKDKDLTDLSIEIVETLPDGDRKIKIPVKSLKDYEKIIIDKLSPGFWNEYVGDKIVFIFKHKDNQIDRIELDVSTEERIDKLAASFMDESWHKKSVWKWLAENNWYKDSIVHTEDGILTNSTKEFNEMTSQEARVKITEKFGKKITTYKLRDWVFSRQRYWGEPIPVINCAKCGLVPVPDKDLPVELPPVKNYKPTETGESPLAAISKWVNVKCPQCVAKKNKTKYFIFDFDGVLGDTREVAIKARMNVFGFTTREEAEKDLMQYFEQKPDHARDAYRSPERIAEDLDWVRRYGEGIIALKPPLFKNFIKEIKKYKNVRLAVVSSGSEKYVKPLLKKSGLVFTHILSFEDHHSKEEKIELICRDWKIDVQSVYYFTDTKADVYELENILDRKKIIGCAWGYHNFEKLNEVLSEKQILKDFKDIHRFFNTSCDARRETDTMPNWAGSSWYYLRYTDPKNARQFAAPDKLAYWTPVDWYNGGNEHTTLHLLYSRFWHRFLYDQGLVPTPEPYRKRTSHGLILAKGGEKMSKSKGNVVNPDGIVEAVGADALRLYEMFMGPFDQAIAWDENGIVGTRRFIEKVWKLRQSVGITEKIGHAEKKIDRLVHVTIKKVSEDIEAMHFNTAVSALMILVNGLESFAKENGGVGIHHYEILLQLLAPFAPHVTEELWHSIGHAVGHAVSIHAEAWPTYDPAKIAATTVRIAVQINGKSRAAFEASADESEATIRDKALALDEIKTRVYGKDIKKVIYVKGRLINIVVGDITEK
jgi:leucyl-tRNA synthetase